MRSWKKPNRNMSLVKFIINRILARLLTPQGQPGHKIRHFLVFLLVLSPVILLCGISFYQTYQSTTALILARRSAVAIPVAESLHIRIEKVIEAAQALAIHPVLRAYVDRGEWDKTAGVMSVYKDLMSDKIVDRIVLADPKGIGRAQTEGLQTLIGTDFSYRDWHRGVISAGGAFVSPVYQRANPPKENIVTVAVPVITDDQKIGAVMGFQIPVNRLHELGSRIPFDSTGFIFIFDQEGNIIYHPRLVDGSGIVTIPPESPFRKANQGMRGTVITTDPVSGEGILAMYESVVGFNWGVVVAEECRTIFATRTNLLLGIGIIYLLVIVFYGIFIELILRGADLGAGKTIE